MPLSPGSPLPETAIQIKHADGIDSVGLAEWANGRRVVLFLVPGAFTPTCSAKHLPGFIQHAEVIRAKGVAEIGCLSVNDAHVMHAWGAATGASGKITMLADPLAEATTALGVSLFSTPVLGNNRASRAALIADKGLITHAYQEEPGAFGVSSAEHILEQL